MDDYTGRREANMETVSEAVARALVHAHNPIDDSSKYDPEWLSRPVSERIQIMRDRLDNGCEALSGEPLPDTEIKNAGSRKKMQRAGRDAMDRRRKARKARDQARADRQKNR
jgi:hypothetical protein